MRRHTKSSGVEFSISPHQVRQGWQVARIVYDANAPEHRARISEAVRTLLAPTQGCTDRTVTPGGIEK